MVKASLSLMTGIYNIDGYCTSLELLRQIQASGKCTTGGQMFNLCKLICHMVAIKGNVNSYLATLCTANNGTFTFTPAGDIEVSFSQQSELDIYNAARALLLNHEVEIDTDPIIIPSEVMSSGREELLSPFTSMVSKIKLFSVGISSQYEISDLSTWETIAFTSLSSFDSGEENNYNISERKYTVPENTCKLDIRININMSIGYTGHARVRWYKNNSISPDENKGSDVYYGGQTSVTYNDVIKVIPGDYFIFQVRQTSGYQTFVQPGTKLTIVRY